MYQCRFCEKSFQSIYARNAHENKHNITQLITKDFLINKYVLKKMTMKEIADNTKFTEWQVWKALKIYGLTRSTSESLKIRGTLKGKNHPMYGTDGGFYGKSHTDKTKKKMSLSRKNWLNNPNNKNEIMLMYKKSKATRKGKLQGKTNPNWKGGHYKECEICGKKFWVVPAREDKKCCSFKCAMEYVKLTGKLKLENNPNWHDGISFEEYPYQYKLMKPIILERDDYECKLCGSKRRVSVHHIDYNKKNNTQNNLIVLCTKCNSKVNFNREFWMFKLKELVANTIQLSTCKR